MLLTQLTVHTPITGDDPGIGMGRTHHTHGFATGARAGETDGFERALEELNAAIDAPAPKTPQDFQDPQDHENSDPFAEEETAAETEVKVATPEQDATQTQPQTPVDTRTHAEPLPVKQIQIPPGETRAAQTPATDQSDVTHAAGSEKQTAPDAEPLHPKTATPPLGAAQQGPAQPRSAELGGDSKTAHPAPLPANRHIKGSENHRLHHPSELPRRPLDTPLTPAAAHPRAVNFEDDVPPIDAARKDPPQPAQRSTLDLAAPVAEVKSPTVLAAPAVTPGTGDPARTAMIPPGLERTILKPDSPNNRLQSTYKPPTPDRHQPHLQAPAFPVTQTEPRKARDVQTPRLETVISAPQASGFNVTQIAIQPATFVPPQRPSAPFGAARLQQEEMLVKGHSQLSEIPLQSRTELTPTPQTPTGQLSSRPEVQAQVIRQIVDAMQNTAARSVDITLSPEELGRVRLAMSHSETGIVVNVIAERAETLDLLRRNISDLSQQFQALGYNTIAFSFAGGEGQNQRTNHQEDERSQSSEMPMVGVSPSLSTQILASGTGIDLRL